MQPNRPTSVLVIAILHFVLGGLGLACGLMNTASTAITMANPGLAAGGAGNPGANFAVAQNQYLDAHAPYWKVITMAFTIVDILISVVMIIAGFGLLQMRPWGRSLSLFYAGASIVFQIGRLLFSLCYLLPTLTAFYDSFLATAAPGPQTQTMAIMRPFLYPLSLLGLVGLIYPIVVFVIMLRPSVAAAFRGAPTVPDDADRPEPTPTGYGDAAPGYGDPDDRFGAAPR